jgi:threonine synthase
MNYKLICAACGKNYSSSKIIWRCECGNYLDLDFHPVPDIDSFKGKTGIWRYRSVLPLEDDANIVSFYESATPLVPVEIYGRRVLCKLDYLMPSGSFKDRGASVMISKCKELGITEIVEDSSGNAAGAISAYCKKAGIKANIFMPAGNSTAKSVQARAFGASIRLVEGSRSDCADAALKAAERCYYAAHAWNPFFIQGAKSIIYEITEQLGWKAPEYFIAPAASGSQIIGAYLGLCEMMEAGIIDRMSKIIAVQSENCAPLKFYSEGRNMTDEDQKPTIAEGISIRKPVRLSQTAEAVKMSGGAVITVSEREIIEALRECLSLGLYTEPTSAAAVAALKKLPAQTEKQGKTVVTLTGNGLKCSPAIERLIS